MPFYFESFEAFVHMEGHGVYVWACYAATMTVFAVLILFSRARKTKFIQQQRAIVSRQAQDVQTEVTDHASG